MWAVELEGPCEYPKYVVRFPFIRVGLLFAFAPLLVAFITGLTQGVSMWDESSGTGAFIWLMIVTLPVGFVLVVLVLVMTIIRMRRRQ